MIEDILVIIVPHRNNHIKSKKKIYNIPQINESFIQYLYIHPLIISQFTHKIINYHSHYIFYNLFIGNEFKFIGKYPIKVNIS